jgi:hypothetical protein
VTVDGVLDWQLDLFHFIINYNWVSPDSLSLPTHDCIYHSNSAAIITAATLVTGELQGPFLPWIPTSSSPTHRTLRTELNSRYQLNSEVYDLWSDCREDSAFGIGYLAITREMGTLRPRACTLPSNVYSMACTSQYHCISGLQRRSSLLIPEQIVIIKTVRC